MGGKFCAVLSRHFEHIVDANYVECLTVFCKVQELQVLTV